MWVKLSCCSPRLAPSASVHQKRFRTGQGNLGTNTLWARPTWGRQAGLPALMYALRSPLIAHHLSVHAGSCAALRSTQSHFSWSFGTRQFSFWRAPFSRERRKVPAVCQKPQPAPGACPNTGSWPSSLRKHPSTITWPTPRCMVLLQPAFRVGLAFREKAKCRSCSWKPMVLAELKLG